MQLSSGFYSHNIKNTRFENFNNLLMSSNEIKCLHWTKTKKLSLIIELKTQNIHTIG